MRVPLGWKLFAGLMLTLAVAATVQAQTTTYYMHGELPYGNVDGSLSLSTDAPDEAAPNAYHLERVLSGGLGSGGAAYTFNPATFVGPSVALSDATVTVDWYMLMGPVQQAAWWCCWDPGMTINLYVGSTAAAGGGGFTQFNADPPVPPMPYSYTFTGVTGVGQLRVQIDGWLLDEADMWLLYDADDAPSRVTVVNGNGPAVADLQVTPDGGGAPLDVLFDASGTTDDLGSFTWTLDVDSDGTPDYPLGGPGDEFDILTPIPHTYTAVGTYTATLDIVDSGGLASQATVEVQVFDGLAVDLGGPHAVSTGSILNLNPSVTGGDLSESYTCSWTGAVSDASSCRTDFKSDRAGTFPISVTVTRGGDTAMAATDVTVFVGDVDGDGIPDREDNCANHANANQLDTDGDGAGDACDIDDDNDSIRDQIDNCPLTANKDQNNTDLDALGDACDEDDDNDGILDGVDNCPFEANADQADLDRDGLGDVCDVDRDGDGIADAFDEFPDDKDNHRDLDKDGVGDGSDLDADGDGVLDADEKTLGSNADNFNSQPAAQLGPRTPVETADKESPGLGLVAVIGLLGVALLRRR